MTAKRNRPLQPLTERDLDVLGTLDFTNHGSRHPIEWARPLDVGGTNCSHHSPTLAKLARRGLVEAKNRSAFYSRGAKQYRITEQGRAVVVAHVKAGRVMS